MNMINRCFETSSVPEVLKHATVYPLLKRPNLAPSVLANYRPISNLSFTTKILEKVVLQQLQKFLDENKIFEVFQSGFRKYHSTETALLKVLNDINWWCWGSCCACAPRLEGCFWHCGPCYPAYYCVGIKGSALKWFKSYFSNRSFRVNIGEYSSGVASLSCGVPQGSILAPILFSLYMLPLGSIFRKHGLSFHCYADTQIYLPLKQSSNGLEALMSCLFDLKAGLYFNFLNFNESKTEIIVFGPSDSRSTPKVNLGDLTSSVKPWLKNLGVIFGDGLKFDKQINTVVKSYFFSASTSRK